MKSEDWQSICALNKKKTHLVPSTWQLDKYPDAPRMTPHGKVTLLDVDGPGVVTLIHKFKCFNLILIITFIMLHVYILNAKSITDYYADLKKYTEARNFIKAEGICRNAIKEYPDQEGLYSYQIWILRKNKKIIESINIGEEAINKWPGSDSLKEAITYSMAAQVSILLDRKKEQEAYDLSVKARNYNVNGTTELWYSICLKRIGKLAEAIDAYEKGMKKYPDISYFKANLIYAYVDLGKEYRDKNLLEKAFEYYLKAYQMDSKNETAVLWYGIIVKEKGEYKKAVEILTKGLKLFPDSQHIRNNLLYSYVEIAHKLREQNKDKEALTIYKKTYELDGANETSILWYGISLRENKKYDQAIRILKKGNKLFPKSEYMPSNLSVAYQEKVDYLVKQGNVEPLQKMAKELKSNLKGTFHSDISTFKAIAKIYDVTEKFDESVEFFKSKLKKYPNEHELINLIGEQLNKQQHTMSRDNIPGKEKVEKEANQFLRKAMTVFENNNPNRPRLTNVGLPVKGFVKVVSIWDGGGTHSGYLKYCYDFMHVDETGSTIKKNTEGKENSDYHCFGAKIYAMMDGTVTSVNDGYPEREIDQIKFTQGNNVVITDINGINYSYVHMKKNSITVKKRDKVKKGDVIGEVGSSGMSYIPHLHMGIYDKDWKSIYFEFESVTINDGTKTFQTTKPYQQDWVIEKK